MYIYPIAFGLPATVPEIVGGRIGEGGAQKMGGCIEEGDRRNHQTWARRETVGASFFLEVANDLTDDPKKVQVLPAPGECLWEHRFS